MSGASFSDSCKLTVGHKSEELAAQQNHSDRSYVRSLACHSLSLGSCSSLLFTEKCRS